MYDCGSECSFAGVCVRAVRSGAGGVIATVGVDVDALVRKLAVGESSGNEKHTYLISYA